MENTLNYHSLISQLQFSFKKKNKRVNGYAYNAVDHNCSETFIKVIAKYPEVSLKQLVTATKTINDFNFMLDEYNYLWTDRQDYIDLIQNTKSKAHLINERLFSSFKGL